MTESARYLLFTLFLYDQTLSYMLHRIPFGIDRPDPLVWQREHCSYDNPRFVKVQKYRFRMFPDMIRCQVNHDPGIVPKFEWSLPSGPPLRILPADYSDQLSQHDVKISAGVGWGDGHHATTRLCISFLAKYTQSNKSVLDFGTGSGILAIVANKLGCTQIVGIDIDDEAIEKAAENVQLNDIDISKIALYNVRETQVDFSGVSFRDDPSGASHQFDMVVANILIGPLIKLAAVLSFAVKEDSGKLCLSGLREEQLPALETVYAQYGIIFEEVSTEEQRQWRVGAEGEGRWAQVTARRRALSPLERRAAAAAWNDAAVS